MKKNQSTSPSLSTIITLMVITIIGVWAVATRYSRGTKPIAQQPDQSVVPLTTNFKKIISSNAFFYSKVYPKLDKTFISIPYKFTSNPQPLWLILETQAGIPRIGRLMYHPDLEKLDWHTVTNGTVTLYQREPTYTSVEDFIQSPPHSGVLIDPPLTVIADYVNLKNADLIPESGHLDLNTHQYILTSYSPPRHENDYNFYETTIDATIAQPNDRNELVWLIHAPDAGDNNPYLLGNIHVDYR